jgi:cold shock CspA family protein
LKKSGIEEVEKGDRLAFDIEKSDKGMRAVNISRA